MAYGKYDNPMWIGKRYGSLTVIGYERVKSGNNSTQWYWKVRCDCGTEKLVAPVYLIQGRIVSCGCYRMTGEKNPYYKHGGSGTKLFKVWGAMLERCDPKSARSKDYGKRGIKVCDEWRKYDVFAAWAKENGYAEGLTIERIDVNGDYCPQNCKWIEFRLQGRNKRNTHYVEYGGKKMSLAEACEIANMPYKTVFNRMRKNHWPVEKALTIPLNETRKWKRSERFSERYDETR